MMKFSPSAYRSWRRASKLKSTVESSTKSLEWLEGLFSLTGRNARELVFGEGLKSSAGNPMGSTIFGDPIDVFFLDSWINPLIFGQG